MALFTEALIDETIALVRQRYQSLGHTLGSASPAADDNSAASLLRTQLRLLIQVANGELSHTSMPAAMIRDVETALTCVLDALLGNALQARVSVPDFFWQTAIGVVASRVRWWLSADDLITISNAAALAFGANTQAYRMRIARAIDSGLLDWVPDPSVVNPQQNRRVLRPQVERLRDQRRLPD